MDALYLSYDAFVDHGEVYRAVRELGSAIRFALDHSLDYLKEYSFTTSFAAVRGPVFCCLRSSLFVCSRRVENDRCHAAQAELAAAAFGRDEDNTAIELRQQDIVEVISGYLALLDDSLPYIALMPIWSKVVLDLR